MASFLSEIAGDQFPIYNKKAVTAVASYGSNPVGTGSYKFISRQPGVDVRFEAFPDHFQGPPPVKYLTYRIIADDFTAGVALETGDVDLIWSTGAATAATLRNNKNLVVSSDPSNRVNYISLNNEKPPFNNVYLRRALNYAINRETIRDIVYEGLSINKDYMGLPWMTGFAEPATRYTYDLEKAKALAAQAGVSKEKPITATLIVTTAAQKLGEVIQQDLAAIGVNLTLDLLEFNTWITAYYAGDFQVGAGGFYMVFKDMNILSWFYDTEAIDDGNSARYSNKTVDSLFLEGRRETDPAKRTVIYKRLVDIIQDDAPYIVYSNPYTIRAYNSNLNIAHVYSNGILIRDISWK
jgi:peptide/nickel transport system substrate-binding protein